MSKWGQTVCTGYKLTKFLSTAAADMPRRSGFPQGSGEVLERDRGFANPLSLSNRPREEQIKSTRMTWYSPLVKPERKSTAKRRYHFVPQNYIPHSLPVEGGCSRSRSRTIYVGNGSLILVSKRTCTNSTHIQSPYKSFAELFQKRPFPRSPRPPRSPISII